MIRVYVWNRKNLVRTSGELFMWPWKNYCGPYRRFQEILTEGMEKALMEGWVRE